MFFSKLKTAAILWTLAILLENTSSSESAENGLDNKEKVPEKTEALKVEPEQSLLTELTRQIQDLKLIVQSQELKLAKMQEKNNISNKFRVSNTCGGILEATGGQINYINRYNNTAQLDQSFPMKCIWTIRTEREFIKITTNQDMNQMAASNNAAFVFEFADGGQPRLKSTQLRPVDTQLFKGPVLFVWLSIPDPNPGAFTFQLLFESLGDIDTNFDNQLSHFTHHILEYSPSHQINNGPAEVQTTFNTVNSVVTLTSNFSTKMFLNINQHNVNCSAKETMMIYAKLKQESGEVHGTNCCVTNCESIVVPLDSPLVSVIVKRYEDPLLLSLSMLSESLYEPNYVYQENENCGGVISGLNGVIYYKSMYQYNNNERCVWAIVPGRYATKSIHLTVTYNGLEPHYDKLYMMEILDKNGSMLANTPKITNLTGTSVTYVGSGKEVYIVFYSDMSITGKGFRIKYSLEPGETTHTNIYNKYHIQSSLNGSIPITIPRWQRQQHSIVITPKVEQSQVDSVLRFYFASSSEGLTSCHMPNYVNVFVTTNGVFYQLSEPFECTLSNGIHTVMNPVTINGMALIIVDNGDSNLDVKASVVWEITELQRNDVSYIKTNENQCGGVIKANSGVIQYKPHANLQPDEACVWTIVTETAVIDLKLVKEGLDKCCSSLSLFTVDGQTSTLSNQTMLSRNNPDNTVDSSVAIIVLRADKRQNGTGFYLEFESTGLSDAPTNFIATHNTQPSGRHSLIWQTTSNDDSAYAQTIHIFSHNNNASDSVLINSNFHYGLFRKENECAYETITVYGFEVNGERRLAQLPRPEEKSGCLELVAVAKIYPWFTTSSSAFVAIQRTFSRNPITSFDWEQQQKKDRPFPPEVERRKWHNGIVKYTIDTETLDATTIKTLEATFREFERKTCVRFEPRQTWDRAYTEFRGGATCNHVGGCGMDGKQTTSLGLRCRAINSIAHMVMLTLCYPDYEKRPDRDQWLSYNECEGSNKQPPKIDPNWPVGESLFDYTSTSGGPCCHCDAMGKPTMGGVECSQCGWNVTKSLGIMDPDMINELYDCQGCYRHRWRKIENAEKIPTNDIVTFAKLRNGQVLSLCRGYVNGEVLIGNFLESSNLCYVLFGGKYYQLTKDAQIFTVPNGQVDMPGATYQVIDKNDVGKSGMGNLISVCRTPGHGHAGYAGVVSFDDTNSVGKVWQQMMYVIYYPKEASIASKVLTCG